jgi:hypothetical protein
LPFIFELETWTNDRISAQLSILHRVPENEWVTGPQASVVMAAYCHPRPNGGRFNGPDRGAWYAARKLETAQAEIAYHRGRELAEIGVSETRIEMRLYLADFNADFHDLRGMNGAIHDPGSYQASQTLARGLFEDGANGVVYGSVRHEGGECVACFRPKLVTHVRPGAHFEFLWGGDGPPRVRHLK